MLSCNEGISTLPLRDKCRRGTTVLHSSFELREINLGVFSRYRLSEVLASGKTTMFLAADIAAIAKLGEITPANTVEFIDLACEALMYRLKSSAGKRKEKASTAALAAQIMQQFLCEVDARAYCGRFFDSAENVLRDLREPGETDNTLNIFKQPVRQITDLATLERFEKSFVRRELLEFLQNVSDSLKTTQSSQGFSANVSKTLDFLERIECTVGEYGSPGGFQVTKRYGDPAFRLWYVTLKSHVKGELPKSRNSVRITCFSFGEPSRLDYGTGHELSFCAFLLCCLKLNVYTSRDMYHLGVSVFPKYNSVIRKVILTYR
ncbi:hypothetical protein BE221DRAFT_142806 [Ostreococcus tauri]|uniref:Serine/threonine-protein phosphatase 2A activator n=1 Tax=Ostreococcus tauri TaxID=70448 RepID=A0A1Y5HXV5_OSTTA|nr:hypothetical protein BE221DRAFT_142806 [Ostreococcus tauri]